MVISYNDQKQSEKAGLKGGTGTARFRELLSQEQLAPRGRMFSVITLEPGDSIGEHRHVGESETYVILDGIAQYRDNGKEILLHKGDCAYCADGDIHMVKNIGDKPLSFVALILYS